MIKKMRYSARHKRADITRYRHTYLILLAYLDAFECYHYIKYDITLVQKSYCFCNINFALFFELLSDKEFSQDFVYKHLIEQNYL